MTSLSSVNTSATLGQPPNSTGSTLLVWAYTAVHTHAVAWPVWHDLVPNTATCPSIQTTVNELWLD